MNYNRLGMSGLMVSPICLGTMMFGGRTSEQLSRRIVASARDAGVNFIDRSQVMEREIAFGFCLAMTFHAVVSKKRSSKAGKILVDLLSGCVNLATCHRQKAPEEHCPNKSDLVHTSSSFTGPVPASNCLANLSFMLKRSQFCPAARRSVA